MRRLLPFLLLMYMLAFLDRANIGFAQKALQHEYGFSNAAFAFGRGLFSSGYALFLKVPRTCCCSRGGQALECVRIMVTWGLVSAAMAFAHTATMFPMPALRAPVWLRRFFPRLM